ncbi:MAG: VTC domain-containing protein [bacterium]|nr:VTC domain-containing protein [bacterium]
MEPLHELKYVFSRGRAHLFRQWLEARCRPDLEFPAGVVCSIYYDTRDWQSLGEKVNSDYLKTKIRIRWYEDIHSREPLPDSFLEAKYKIGATREKIRLQLHRNGKWFSQITLDNPELLNFPRMLWQKGIMTRAPFYPAFQVNYKRLRFIEPVTKTRLSLDYDICAPAVNSNMLPRTNPFQLPQAVFEVKGTADRLPDSLHPLTALGCRKESFSKYGKCFEKIMRITF